jgi:glycyl-tRNA synthetase beta chain
LRRAAQGVVKVLIDHGDRFKGERAAGIEELVDQAHRNYRGVVGAADQPWKAVLFEFLCEREAHIFERRGYRADEVRSVAGFWKRPLSAQRRLEVLVKERGSPDMTALAGLLKRVKNITKDVTTPQAMPEVKVRLKEPAELALANEIERRWPKFQAAQTEWRYADAMKEIVGLRESVDRFFVDVLVMTDDRPLREARLGLLSILRDTITSIADISELASDDLKQA